MIRIREMQIDDLDEVLQIEEESFSVPWTANGFFTFLIREDALFLSAVEEEKIVGYIGLIQAGPEADITNVAVKESCRGKGIGRLLVGRMLDLAKSRGVEDIFLEVRVSNDPAIRLYRSFGFEPVGLRKDYYEEPKEDASVMKYSIFTENGNQ